MKSPAEGAIPWTTDEALRWLATTSLAAVICAVAWYLASGKDNLEDQVSYVNLAVAGLVLGCCGHTIWFVRGRRRISLRRTQLFAGPLASSSASLVTDRPGTQDVQFVSGQGLRRYHRRDCALAASRNWRAADRAVHEAGGRLPCGVCKP